MSKFDSSQAEQEGWAVINVDGLGYEEIERDDHAENDAFASDADALQFVIERAREGSEYHRRALAICNIIVSGPPEERPRVV